MSIRTEKKEKLMAAIQRMVFNTSQINVSEIVSEFGVSRQTVYSYIKKLISDKKIRQDDKKYLCIDISSEKINLNIADCPDEDKVYKKYIEPRISHFDENIVSIIRFGFTEMFNNVIDHSSGKTAVIYLMNYGFLYVIAIKDDGVGIFTKIKDTLKLDSPRESILELAKGKFTSDPNNHTGQGIFYTSRIFDYFTIHSKDLVFAHESSKDVLSISSKWGVSTDSGTDVIMVIFTDSDRTMELAMSKYSSDDDMSFDRTEVELTMLSEDGNDLVSRTQARRLLTSLDKFKVITLDFKGIKSIGISFADEVFRVFQNNYPSIEIIPINTIPVVEKMILRARNWDKSK